MNIENFERAFSSGMAGCRNECHCGKEFYNPANDWDWEDGELKALDESGAIISEYSIGTLIFEGNEFVGQCDCWHDRATKIMAFIDSHDRQFGEYLNLERKRKIGRANFVPVVKT